MLGRELRGPDKAPSPPPAVQLQTAVSNIAPDFAGALSIYNSGRYALQDDLSTPRTM